MSSTSFTPHLITPEWPVPSKVMSISTTRIGGLSRSPFDSFNLGIRAGDDPDTARKNRALLGKQARLPTEPCWLWQVHSTRVVDAAGTKPETQADASWTDRSGVVCVALAADCLPVLLADSTGSLCGCCSRGVAGAAKRSARIGDRHVAGTAGRLTGVARPCHRSHSF